MKKRNIIINSLKDVDESSKITEKSRWAGVIYVEGGVPKNFIWQTAVKVLRRNVPFFNRKEMN